MGLKPHLSHLGKFMARLKSCPFAHVRPGRVFHQAVKSCLFAQGCRECRFAIWMLVYCFPPIPQKEAEWMGHGTFDEWIAPRSPGAD
jgi:hypothetical protein